MELHALTSFSSFAKGLNEINAIDKEIERLRRLRAQRIKILQAERLKAKLAAQEQDKVLLSPTEREGLPESESVLDLRTLGASTTLEEDAREARRQLELELGKLPFGFRLPVDPFSKRGRFALLIVRSLRRFTKGFLVGWAVKSIFKLLPAIVRSKGNMAKILEALEACLAKDQWRYGVFLGTLLLIFQTVMRALRKDPGLLGMYRGAVAGSVAGLALFLLPADSRAAIAVFFFVRAFEIAIKKLAQDGVIPSFEHGDTVLMSLASAQILWAMVHARDSLDKGYLHFLDIHAGRPRAAVAALETWCNTGGAAAATAAVDPVACKFLHPADASCTVANIRFFFQEFMRALPVYVPVYLIPAILFRPKALVFKPVATASSLTQGILRSTIFLSAYCTLAWTGVCMNQKLLNLQLPGVGVRRPELIAFSGLLSGLSLLIEKKHRRIELALYVFSHAAQSFWRVWRKRGFLPYIQNGPVWLFAGSLAVIMHAFVSRPQLLRPSYLRLLAFFFGSGMASWAHVGPDRLADRPFQPLRNVASLRRFDEKPQGGESEEPSLSDGVEADAELYNNGVPPSMQTW